MKKVNLNELPTSSNSKRVGTVRHTVHIVTVTLLFENVCLALPLPYQELTVPPTPKP